MTGFASERPFGENKFGPTGGWDEPERVMYVEVTEGYWRGAARRLSELRGWRPVYWVSAALNGSRYFDELKSAFPGCITHNRLAACRNEWPAEVSAPERGALDVATLDDLGSVRSMGLRMMDRLDPDQRSFTLSERVDHLNALSSAVDACLQVVQPTLILFQEIPGLVSDYLLYELAQRRGIQTVLFHRTWDPVRAIPIGRFEDGSKALLKRYERLLAEVGDCVLAPASEQHLAEMRMPAPQVRIHVDANFAPPDMSEMQGRPVFESLTRSIRRLRRVGNLLQRSESTCVKMAGTPLTGSRPTNLRWHLMRIQGDRRKRKLKRLYHKSCSAALPNDPFVYVPLHYQPEVTTAPLGGVFVDQAAMVRLLADAIPPGWRIVVREHPATFQPRTDGHKSRSAQFYDGLTSLSNVQLTPTETESLELTDRAAAVATVTGTAGWEAVTRGRPVLLFGAAWYRGCDGVHDIRTRNDLDRFFETAEALTGPQPERLRRFVRALDDVSYDICTNVAFSELARERQIDTEGNLCRALTDYVPSEQPQSGCP